MAKAWQRVLMVILLTIMWISAGCSDIQIMEESRKTHVAVSTKEATVEHAFQLAIVGIDFDPPLTYVENIRKQGVTLLVAVENQGQTQARDVRIIAHLFLDPRKEQVIERMGVIPLVDPGGMEVYRFPRLRNIPLRHTYILEIQLTTPDGQRVISQRTYTVNVSR